MSKSRHSTKEEKKPPAMNPKEKKAAKRARKDAEDAVQPFLPPRVHSH
jgi:hypothetical protein